MSTIYFITKMRTSKAAKRRFIVRTIEGVIILAAMFGGLWLICTMYGLVFKALGVG